MPYVCVLSMYKHQTLNKNGDIMNEDPLLQYTNGTPASSMLRCRNLLSPSRPECTPTSALSALIKRHMVCVQSQSLHLQLLLGTLYPSPPAMTTTSQRNDGGRPADRDDSFLRDSRNFITSSDDASDLYARTNSVDDSDVELVFHAQSENAKVCYYCCY